MTIGITVTLRNSRLQLFLDELDDGADEYSTPHLLIYSGDRPETGGELDEYDNDLLVDFELPYPSGTVDAGVLTFGEIADQTALAYGIASWARLTKENGDFVADLSVTDEDGDGDVKMNILEIFVGGVVSCTVASITEGNA